MNRLACMASILFLVACEVKPAEMNYGTDACVFCKMSIVDKQHAAQLVTVKGKAYKYDAIECMMNDLAQWNRPGVELFLIADYSRPGRLIDARTAYYLISEAIPSPMGEFLSAFGEKEDRDVTLQTKGGQAFNWSQLQVEF